MNVANRRRCPLLTLACAVLVAGAGNSAMGQGAIPSSDQRAPPNGYYLGGSQGFVHDSNVYRIPDGQSDNYSLTSLLAGFDQSVGRQRVFGLADVHVSRYQHQTELDNTGYSLLAGVDGSTVHNLSGAISTSLSQTLAAPAANGVVPVATQEQARLRSVNGRIRWGEELPIMIESRLGYSKVSYSSPAYAASNFDGDLASLGVFYQPGGRLRIGVAARFDRTRTPEASVDAITGATQSNTVRGSSLDLLAGYTISSVLSTAARVSYTHQSNSNDALNAADFSGFTGGLDVDYQATGKIGVKLFAARAANLNAPLLNGGNGVGVAQPGASLPAAGGTVTSNGLQQTNQLTDSIGLRLVYRATSKITATTGLGYARARLVATASNPSSDQGRDTQKTAYLGANWNITRAVGLDCRLARETRNVSGTAPYSYGDTTVGCAARLTLR